MLSLSPILLYTLCSHEKTLCVINWKYKQYRPIMLWGINNLYRALPLSGRKMCRNVAITSTLWTRCREQGNLFTVISLWPRAQRRLTRSRPGRGYLHCNTTIVPHFSACCFLRGNPVFHSSKFPARIPQQLLASRRFAPSSRRNQLPLLVTPPQDQPVTARLFSRNALISQTEPFTR